MIEFIPGISLPRRMLYRLLVIDKVIKYRVAEKSKLGAWVRVKFYFDHKDYVAIFGKRIRGENIGKICDVYICGGTQSVNVDGIVKRLLDIKGKRTDPEIRMKNVAQLIECGYDLKNGETVYFANSDIPYRYSEEKEMLCSSSVEVKFEWEGIYLHPLYPNRKIKGIEIIKEAPAFREGDVFVVEEASQEVGTPNHSFFASDVLPAVDGVKYNWEGVQHFTTLDFMLDFPQFFKPLYE